MKLVSTRFKAKGCEAREVALLNVRSDEVLNPKRLPNQRFQDKEVMEPKGEWSQRGCKAEKVKSDEVVKLKSC